MATIEQQTVEALAREQSGELPVLATVAAASSATETRSCPAGRIYTASRRWMHLSLLLGASGILLAAVVLRPSGPYEVQVPLLGFLPSLCTWRNVFGIPCPGCGLTRCFVALAHFQFAEAWRFNPAGYFFFAVIAYQIPFRSVQLWRLRRGRPDYRHGTLTVAIVCWLAVVLLFTQWVLNWRAW